MARVACALTSGIPDCQPSKLPEGTSMETINGSSAFRSTALISSAISRAAPRSGPVRPVPVIPSMTTSALARAAVAVATVAVAAVAVAAVAVAAVAVAAVAALGSHAVTGTPSFCTASIASDSGVLSPPEEGSGICAAKTAQADACA